MEDQTCGDAYQPDALHRWVCDLPPGHPGQHGGPCTRWESRRPRPARRDWHSGPDSPAQAGPGMKVYVWTGVLRDYTAGMIVAVAPDLESALAATAEDYVRAEMGAAAPEVIEIGPDTKPRTWHVYGGG